MTPLEQLIYDFCKKNHTFTLLDTDEAREYTEEKAKELAALVGEYFANTGGVKMYVTPPGTN